MGQLQPNEEVDVSVRLSIPETTGRHVTYFRLRTKEGNIFGQRLWADLRVTEPDADWVGVKDTSVLLNNSNTHSFAPSTTVPVTTTAAATAISAINVAPPTESSPAPINATAPVFVTSSVAPVSVPTPTVAASVPVESLKQVLATTAPVAVNEVTDVWANVWSRELQILADMGFTDTAALIPLLQEHVGLPVSLCPQLNGVPPSEGMQKLVAVVLSRSGTFNF